MIPSVPASAFLVAGVFLAIALLRAMYARVFGPDHGREDQAGGESGPLAEIRSLNDWPEGGAGGDDGRPPADPDAVACPNCLARNDPSYAFCRECAAELPE